MRLQRSDRDGGRKGRGPTPRLSKFEPQSRRKQRTSIIENAYAKLLIWKLEPQLPLKAFIAVSDSNLGHARGFGDVLLSFLFVGLQACDVKGGGS